MPTNTIYIGNQCRKNNTPKVTGNYVDLNGETFYKISHYDQMKDFFMSVVSDSNHWIFISSLGGLSAGRARYFLIILMTKLAMDLSTLVVER